MTLNSCIPFGLVDIEVGEPKTRNDFDNNNEVEEDHLRAVEDHQAHLQVLLDD